MAKNQKHQSKEFLQKYETDTTLFLINLSFVSMVLAVAVTDCQQNFFLYFQLQLDPFNIHNLCFNEYERTQKTRQRPVTFHADSRHISFAISCPQKIPPPYSSEKALYTNWNLVS